MTRVNIAVHPQVQGEVPGRPGTRSYRDTLDHLDHQQREIVLVADRGQQIARNGAGE
jgi:hypothetical protein